MNAISDFSIRLEKSINRVKYQDIPLDELQGEMLETAIEEYDFIVKKLKKKRADLKRAKLRSPLKEPDLPEKFDKTIHKTSGKSQKK